MDKAVAFQKGMNGAGHALVPLRQHLVRSRLVPKGPDDLSQKPMLKLGRLFFRRLAPRPPLHFSLRKHRFHHAVFPPRQGFHVAWLGARLERVSVGIHPREHGIAQNAGPNPLADPRARGGAVPRHKHVRGNASAPKHLATQGRDVPQRIDQRHAVFMVQFTRFHADVKVVFIIGIGLLNGAACGGVKTCHRQAQGPRSRHRKLLLNEAFAKGAPPNHHTAVVVLKGTGKNLTGRCRSFIHKHRHGPVHVRAPSPCSISAARRRLAFRVHDGLAFVQKQFHHVHHRIQVSATVAPQIHHHRLGALLSQCRHGCFKFLGGVRGKANGFDVPHVVVHGECGHHTLNGDAVARQLHLEAVILPCKPQRHLGASWALEQFHHSAVGQLRPRDGGAVHFEDAVACAHARSLCRTSRNGCNHHQRVVANDELHADALEVPLHVFGHGAQFFLRVVHRVGIQFLEHGFDGGVHQTAAVKRVHVQVFDAIQDVEQTCLISAIAPLSMEWNGHRGIFAPASAPASQPQADDEGHGQRQGLRILHAER